MAPHPVVNNSLWIFGNGGQYDYPYSLSFMIQIVLVTQYHLFQNHREYSRLFHYHIPPLSVPVPAGSSPCVGLSVLSPFPPVADGWRAVVRTYPYVAVPSVFVRLPALPVHLPFPLL